MAYAFWSLGIKRSYRVGFRRRLSVNGGVVGSASISGVLDSLDSGESMLMPVPELWENQRWAKVDYVVSVPVALLLR